MEFLKIYRDPASAPVETGSPMLDAMNEAEAANPPAGDPPAPVEDKPKNKFAWGDEDRRKTRQELKDDDEIDLGYEEEKDGAKTPAKAKLSRVRETAKFLKENDSLIRAALGMREEFTKNPELSKAFNAFWGKTFEGNKYNPEVVAKFNSMIEGKAEDVKEKIVEQTDDIAEMETLLAELEQDSPQAKIMRGNINSLKATRNQLKEALVTIKTLQEKADGQDKFKTTFEDTQKKQKEDADAKQAAEIFNTEFGALASKEHQFENKNDALELEGATRDAVATLAQQGKITNDEDFKKAIREAAKSSFEKINRRNERIVNEYLKKKGQLPKEAEKPKEKEIEKSPDNETLHDALMNALS